MAILPTECVSLPSGSVMHLAFLSGLLVDATPLKYARARALSSGFSTIALRRPPAQQVAASLQPLPKNETLDPQLEAQLLRQAQHGTTPAASRMRSKPTGISRATLI